MAHKTPSEPTPSTPKPNQPTAPSANSALTPSKTNTGLIIGIVVGALVLLVGIIIAVAVLLAAANKGTTNTSGSESSQQSNSDEDKLRAANTRTANSLSDYSAVCQTGAISNAAAYTKPYRVLALSNTVDGTVWSTVSLEYDAPYSVKYSEYAAVNAVVCLKEQKGAAVKASTCEFTSGGEKKSIDYYATVYDATLYEAKSGKKVKDLGTVSAPADSCPSFVSYDKNDPKIIAKPDSAAVDALVAQFAQ